MHIYRQHALSRNAVEGTLSGIIQKHIPHSETHWFSEFCKSQCLSQFTASFIIHWAYASIAENHVWGWAQLSKAYCLQRPPGNPQDNCNNRRTLQLPLTMCSQKPVPHTYEQVTRFIHSPEHNNTCKWSFRRFTYGNLVTTSPSSKW